MYVHCPVYGYMSTSAILKYPHTQYLHVYIIILYMHFLESSLRRTAFDDSKTEIETECTVL